MLNLLKMDIHRLFHRKTLYITGIIMFWFSKWIISAAFASATLFISILFRNKGLGFLFACLFGTGGLVMGMEYMLHRYLAGRCMELLQFQP